MMNVELMIKKMAMRCGVDVRAFTPGRSESARLAHLLTHYGIDLIFDVGANTGQYATYLRSIGYKGKIVCYEPLSSAYVELQKAASKDPRLILAPRMAIGDSEEVIAINVASNSESSSILNVLDVHVQSEPSLMPIGKELVRICRLDGAAEEYLSGSDNAFLKIDTQGYEMQVLRGAEALLTRIKGIQLELSLIPLYEGELLYREMIDAVENLGFTLHDLNPCYSDFRTGRTYQVDGIFFRL